jgi:hypothetical protein
MNRWVLMIFLITALAGCASLRNTLHPNLLYEEGMKFRVDHQIAACFKIYTPAKNRNNLRCFILPEDAVQLWLNRTIPNLNLHTIHRQM